MEAKLIKDNRTQIKCSNKHEEFVIEQLKFIGAIPTKESKLFTYFEFEGDVVQTAKYLGLKR